MPSEKVFHIRVNRSKVKKVLSKIERKKVKKNKSKLITLLRMTSSDMSGLHDLEVIDTPAAGAGTGAVDITTNTQSQNHGFTVENSVRLNVFGLLPEKNNTDTHDIPKEKNKYNKNENISIKTTGSSTIFCSDLKRFYSYSHEKGEKNTIIVVKYDQIDTKKIVKRIYEIDYNEKCHKHLFGNLPKEEIIKYIDSVKSIPTNVKGDEAKKIFNYLEEKKKLKEKYTHKIQINPKVDSRQSRVQCSIVNFEETLKDFIIYKSSDDNRNLLRGNKIIDSVESGRRKRNKKNK